MSKKVPVGESIFAFSIALLAAWLCYLSPFVLLFLLTIAIGQFILELSPTPLWFYLENEWFLVFYAILVFIIAIVLNYYHHQYSWRVIWGFGFCLGAIFLIVCLLFLLVGWHINIDFVNGILASKGETLEDTPLATPFQLSFLVIFWLIIYGGIGIIFLRMWRTLLAALTVIVSIIFSTAVWANTNNVTVYCFVNGYWEGSPVYEKIIDYLENSDDPGRIYPGIIYVSHLYLSASLVKGDICYTSDDKTRYALLKKYIFYYPDFPETFPKLQDIIAEKAEDNDVPAMLLLAYMYNQGQGVVEDKAQGEMWWDRALSFSADDWVLDERAFIFS